MQAGGRASPCESTKLTQCANARHPHESKQSHGWRDPPWKGSIFKTQTDVLPISCAEMDPIDQNLTPICAVLCTDWPSIISTCTQVNLNISYRPWYWWLLNSLSPIFIFSNGHVYVEAKCSNLVKEEYLKLNLRTFNDRKGEVSSCGLYPRGNWLPIINLSGCLTATVAGHPLSSHQLSCRPSQFGPCTVGKQTC